MVFQQNPAGQVNAFGTCLLASDSGFIDWAQRANLGGDSGVVLFRELDTDEGKARVYLTPAGTFNEEPHYFAPDQAERLVKAIEDPVDVRPEYEEAMMGKSAGKAGGGLHFLNTTIAPSGADGVYHVQTVNLPTARHLHRYFCGHGLFAAIHVGHAAACTAFEALGFGHFEPSRAPWDGYGLGLCLQLRGRIAEGSILTLEEMEAMGYDLRVIYRAPDFARGLDGVVSWAFAAGVDRFRAGEARSVFRQLGVASRAEIRPWADEDPG